MEGPIPAAWPYRPLYHVPARELRTMPRLVDGGSADPDVEFELAMRTECGQDTPMSSRDAFPHFKAAASCGHPGALFSLGMRAETSRNVDAAQPDVNLDSIELLDRPLHCYTVASEGGHVMATFALGRLYDHGHPRTGVSKNVALARQYYEKARRMGSPHAGPALDELHARDQALAQGRDPEKALVGESFTLPDEWRRNNVPRLSVLAATVLARASEEYNNIRRRRSQPGTAIDADPLECADIDVREYIEQWKQVCVLQNNKSLWSRLYQCVDIKQVHWLFSSYTRCRDRQHNHATELKGLGLTVDFENEDPSVFEKNVNYESSIIRRALLGDIVSLAYLLQVVGLHVNLSQLMTYTLSGQGNGGPLPGRCRIIRYIVEKCGLKFDSRVSDNVVTFLYHQRRDHNNNNDGAGNEAGRQARKQQEEAEATNIGMYLRAKGLRPARYSAKSALTSCIDRGIMSAIPFITSFYGMDDLGHAALYTLQHALKTSVAATESLFQCGLTPFAWTLAQNVQALAHQPALLERAFDLDEHGIRPTFASHMKDKQLLETTAIDLVLESAVQMGVLETTKLLVDQCKHSISTRPLIAAVKKTPSTEADAVNAAMLTYLLDRVDASLVTGNVINAACENCNYPALLSIVKRFPERVIACGADAIDAGRRGRGKASWKYAQWWAHFEYDSYGMEYDECGLLREQLLLWHGVALALERDVASVNALRQGMERTGVPVVHHGAGGVDPSGNDSGRANEEATESSSTPNVFQKLLGLSTPAMRWLTLLTTASTAATTGANTDPEWETEGMQRLRSDIESCNKPGHEYRHNDWVPRDVDTTDPEVVLAKLGLSKVWSSDILQRSRGIQGRTKSAHKKR